MALWWPPITLGAIYALIISWLHYKQAEFTWSAFAIRQKLFSISWQGIPSLLY